MRALRPLARFAQRSSRSFCSTNTNTDEGELKFTEKDTLSDENAVKSIIQGYGNKCFQINDVIMKSSVVVLPNISFLWRAQKWEDVTPESLCLLRYLKPAPDLVLIGTGDAHYPLPDDLAEFLETHNFHYECMQTRHAIGTFNITNHEERHVAAFLLAVERPDEAFDVSKYEERDPRNIARKLQNKWKERRV